MEEPQEPPYPCPACGAPLYGWTATRDPLSRERRVILDRCESCRLAVRRAADPPDVEAELATLIGEEPGSFAVPNQGSLAGSLGGAQWAGLDPARRLHLNPLALRLLLQKRGLELAELRTPLTRRSLALMWQTIVNAFTLRDNFRRDARDGRIPRGTGRERLAYWLDAAVTVLVALPALLAAVPLEAVAAARGRGGVIEARAATTPQRSSASSA